MDATTTPTTKRCTKCGEVKPLEAFSKNVRTHDGLQPICKECRNAEAAAYRAANLDKVRASRAAYRAANRDKLRAKSAAAYAAADKDKLRARNAAWAAANRDRVRARHAAWLAAHPGKAREYAAAWRAANPDKSRAIYTRRLERVTPAYAAQILGIRVKDLTPEMLALYREQLLNKRALRELNQLLKGLDHDERTEPEPDGRGDLAGLDDVDHG